MKNIAGFDTLSKNTQRVFKHRLKTKCQKGLKDTAYVLLNHRRLCLNFDEASMIESITELMSIYESLIALRNMYISRKR